MPTTRRYMHPHPPQTDFERLVWRTLSRRGFLRGSAVLGSGAFVAALGVPPSARADSGSGWLRFEPVPANTLDTITVPRGYLWHTVVAWGDPLWSRGEPFEHTTAGTGASQELAFGDSNDGMELFEVDGRTLLAVNHEFANRRFIYPNRASAAPENADDVRKSKAGHGVSIVEIEQHGGRWQVVMDAFHNRRVTADTPIDITGPAAGHALLKTAADPSGTRAFGTWNNCGSGRTPWGTYLTCEENFNACFLRPDRGSHLSPELRRYGIGVKDWGYAWATADERFDISRHPNEPNRAGYIVEIDPRDPRKTPKKRTALGRFKHENAAVVLSRSGQVVVYLGDDERGEFLYRYVSANRYVANADGDDLMDNGQLYVARFDDEGRGEWVALDPTSTAMSAAEICIHTRKAASAVGATTMDRPEWVAVNPHRAEAFCALTNNKHRGRRPNAGGDATPVGGPNPRAANHYGQIVRWLPDNGDHGAPRFDWDLFVMAGNPTVHSDAYAGSANINAHNMFNSPDGLAFDSRGGLWIRTDGDYSDSGDFAGQGNNQMLFADPVSGEIRRFMVGPRECEVTGLCWSADRKTLFVGIQHPGEKGNGHFPDGGDTLPRSCVVAIMREDGGAMG